MNINYRDKSKPITAEDLIRRYNLDGLAKDRKAIQTNKNGLDKTDTLLNEFVESTMKNFQELQDQVDGNITTWFFNGVPTNENQPANEWTTDEEKINHLGDLYYDQDTGYAYRWAMINNEYIWSKIVDADVVEALALANAAQDTADSKRRVFVEEPIPPYDVGDIWIKDDKDLYRCRSTRTSGNFANVDWILATDYSNDDYAKNVEAVLNQFKNDVQTNYVTEVKLETTVDSINANVKSNTEEIKNITQTTNEKEGTNAIYIEDAMGTNAIEYNIKGKSEQETSVQGKNILALSEKTLYFNKFNFSYSLDGYNKITINGTPTANWQSITFKVYPKETGNYIFYYKLGSKSNNITRALISINKYSADRTRLKYKDCYISEVGNTISDYFIVDELGDEYSYEISIYLAANTSDFVQGEASYITYEDLYFGKASDFTGYEPFIPDSPSPDYPSEIKTVKGIRNLFDKDNANILKAYLNSGKLVADENTYLAYIPCEHNTTYTIQKIVSSRFVIYGTIEKPIIGVSGVVYGDTIGDKIVVKTNGTTNYLMIMYYKPNIDTLTEEQIRSSIMVEEGLIAHGYVPYGSWLKTNITNENLFDGLFSQGAINPNNGELSPDKQTWAITTTNLIKVKPNTTYRFFCKSEKQTLIDRIATFDKNKKFISRSNSLNTNIIETDSDTYFIRFNIYYANGITPDDVGEPLFKEGTEETEYKSHQKQEVLIDMNKPNLFNEKTLIQGIINNASITSRVVSLMHKVSKGYTFTAINKNTSKYAFSIGFTSSNVQSGNTFINETGWITDSIKSVSANNEGYMFIQIKKIDDSVLIPSEVVDTDFILYEGYEPYYELASVNEEDNLEVVNGLLTKRIGKVVLDGSEGWVVQTGADDYSRFSLANYIPAYKSNKAMNNKLTQRIEQSHGSYEYLWLQPNVNVVYIQLETSRLTTNDVAGFKSWLSENPVTVYYVLAEEETIQLTPTNVPLFEGVNNIKLIEDVETHTSINYFRNTPLSTTYVNKAEMEAQINVTANEIESKVTVVEEDIKDLNELTKTLATKSELNSSITQTEQLIETKVSAITDTITDLTKKSSGNNILHITNGLKNSIQSLIITPNENLENISTLIIDKSTSITSEAKRYPFNINSFGKTSEASDYIKYEDNKLKLYKNVQTRRNIKVGDNLSGRKIICEFPNDLYSEIKTYSGEEFGKDFIIIGNYCIGTYSEPSREWYNVNYLTNSDLSNFLYNYEYGTVMTNDYSVNLPDYYGRVTEIDANNPAYKYIFIEVEENLDEPIVTELTNFIDNIFDGDSYIYLLNKPNVHYECSFVELNDMTKSFATREEVAVLEIQSNEIKSEVSQKVNGNEIISTINQSPEQITLKSNRLVIESDNFGLNKDGKITSTAGEIAGFTIDRTDGFTYKIYAPYDYNNDDLQRIMDIYFGKIAPTQNDYERLDINNDGVIDLFDAIIIQWYVEYGITYSSPGEFSIQIPKENKLVTAKTGYFDGYGNLVSGFDYNSVISENGYFKKEVSCETLTQTSLESRKKNFEKLDDALSIIENTDIYKYNMKSEDDNTKKHIGFVIGDKYNYSKEITSKNNDGVDTYSMVSVCFKAIKEQQEIINNLKSRIEVLENEKH